MREIKFRAWDVQTAVIVGYERLQFGPARYACWQKSKDGIDWEAGVFEDFDYARQQYTGLKDKNGNPIYEEDIVRYYDSTTMWLTSKVIDVGGAFALSTNENPILLYEFQHNYVYDGQPIPELEVIAITPNLLSSEEEA